MYVRFGPVVEMPSEQQYSRADEGLSRPHHQLMSWFQTMDIVHRERLKDERNRPRNNGEYLYLTNSAKGIVPNRQVYINKDKPLCSFKETFI